MRLEGEHLIESVLLGQTAAQAPEILERIVGQAAEVRASDIHLQMRPDGAELALRLDGVLSPITTLPRDVGERLCGRIKYLASLKTYQEALPQDGRIDKAALNVSNDIRVATYPTVTGEKVVLRLITPSESKTLAGLGLPEDARTCLSNWLDRASGMLLLTGPAGSGKTTTIYACLEHLSRQGGRHIITIEDPVERVLPGLMQTETDEARGLTFARAARHLLRQDPQVLVIGEIRDEETARIALRASLTGHMILSTIHAGSCPGVLERLAGFCPEVPVPVGGRDLIVNQRLVRRFCACCAGNGCVQCLQTGYKGRIPLVELLVVDEPIRRLVRQGRFFEIKVPASLEQHAQKLINSGCTSESEIHRVL